MREEIEARLKKIISEREEFAFLHGNLDMEADIGELGINSLMFIKIIVAIEEEFDIEFDDDELDSSNLNTFHDFVDYVEELLQ